MWKFKFSLRIGIVIFTAVSVAVSVVAKQEFDRRRKERIAAERKMELAQTRQQIQDGKIHAGLPEAVYLLVADPCEKHSIGPYTEYVHGGALFYGLTIVAKDNRLVRASTYSCLGDETFFNTLTKAEETELSLLWEQRHEDEFGPTMY